MCQRRLLSIFVLLVTSFLAGQTTEPATVQAAMKQLRKEAFHAHMAFLSDDLLEGRAPGTRGHELAARYVAAQFEAMGLRPAGDFATYYQRVPLREITILSEKCELTLTETGAQHRLRWGDDFLMGNIETGEDAQVEAPVVFVGYGVAAPTAGYDDYAGTEVKGKIVAMLWGGPASLPNELRAHVSSPAEKFKAASTRGAVGILTLAGPELAKVLPWDRMVAGAALPAMRWLDASGVPNDSFPTIRVNATLSSAASKRLFAASAKSWAEVLRDAAASRPNTFPRPLTARLHAVSVYRNITSANVAAVLRGSDPVLKNEYVLYTAHIDHLGIGRPVDGDAIYNGAFDNASGIAALLAIADTFASLPNPPKRSVMFLAITGEESGLLGSDYFARNPTVPIEQIAADINFDGATIFYSFKNLIAYGAGDSSLGSVVHHVAGQLGLELSPEPAPELLYFIRSDQYSFVKQGVPALYLTEGYQARDSTIDGKQVRESWLATRYHAPTDDMDQPMDLDGSVQFMQVNFLIGYEIAEERQRSTWNADDFFGETFARN